MTFEQLTTSRLDVELNSNSSEGVWSSVYRTQAVNDGYREFSALTDCWVRRHTLTISCNTAEYNLSTISDYRRLDASGPEYRLTSSGSTAITTVLAGKDDFPRRDEVWLNTYNTGWNASTTPAMPTGWYFRKDGGRLFFGLDRPPDVGSSETCVVRLPYIAEPDAMTASTQVPWTDTNGTRVDLIEYQQALVHYAASKLLPLTGDIEGGRAQLVMFTDYVKRFWGNLRPKGGTHITMARNYLQNARRRPS
jgi:hypothetical protein